MPLPTKPPTVGTPDYQRGVVSAQKLLATVAAGTAAVTVGLPPNIETLKVMIPEAHVGAEIYAGGVTSGQIYPAAVLPQFTSLPNAVNAYIDVSQALDAQVQVVLNFFPAEDWYVVSDQFVSLFVELTLAAASAAPGGMLPPRGLLVAGSDGTDLRFLATDSSGRLEVVSNPAAIHGSHSTVAANDFTGNATLFTITGGGVIIWDASLVSTAAAPVVARVVTSTDYPLCAVGTTLGDDDHFTSSRGLFLAAGVTITSAVGGASTWTFAMNYDQL